MKNFIRINKIIYDTYYKYKNNYWNSININNILIHYYNNKKINITRYNYNNIMTIKNSKNRINNIIEGYENEIGKIKKIIQKKRI